MAIDDSVAKRYFELPESQHNKNSDIVVKWDLPIKDSNKSTATYALNYLLVSMNQSKKSPPVTPEKFYSNMSDLFGPYDKLSEKVKNMYLASTSFANAFGKIS